MKDYQFKLIDSSYETEDAREVLVSLVSDKIRFLNQKILSMEERFSSDTRHLKKRVSELKEELQVLHEKLSHLNDSAKINISCVVDLTVLIQERTHEN